MNAFSEKDGKTSATRLNMLICTLTGCAVALIGILRGTDDLLGLGILCTGIIGTGVTGKVIQKGRE